MPVIDLSFVLVGTAIPLYHVYSLFSSIYRIVPGAKYGNQADQLVSHPIRGRQSAPGVLSLTDRSGLDGPAMYVP